MNEKQTTQTDNQFVFVHIFGRLNVNKNFQHTPWWKVSHSGTSLIQMLIIRKPRHTDKISWEQNLETVIYIACMITIHPVIWKTH